MDETPEKKCLCEIQDREPNETDREWLKRWMCMHHWMQTDYYQRKLKLDDRQFLLVDDGEV